MTLNLNGIRPAASKGWLPWAASIAADCMGVQEIKAQAQDVAGILPLAHRVPWFIWRRSMP